jgi:hypothetical protein
MKYAGTPAILSVHVMRMKDQLKHESRDRKAHVRWLGAAN